MRARRAERSAVLSPALARRRAAAGSSHGGARRRRPPASRRSCSARERMAGTGTRTYWRAIDRKGFLTRSAVRLFFAYSGGVKSRIGAARRATHRRASDGCTMGKERDARDEQSDRLAIVRGRFADREEVRAYGPP